MNIFKILSDGDGTIKEPNVSAFLAYLLDPSQSHGLGSKLLEDFLSNIIFNDKEIYKDLILNGKVKDLSRPDKSGLFIEIRTEEIVQLPNSKRRRDIDILIEIYKKDASYPLYAFCIENKIRDSALNENQLIEEVKGIINEYEKLELEMEILPRISMTMITPNYSIQSKKAFSEFLNQLTENNLMIPANHLTWESVDGSNNSISKFLTNILRIENEGLIDPIHEYTKFTIKSFLNFILTGFKSYQEEKEKTGKYKRIRFTESEYWSYNKESRLLDIAKAIKNYVEENYQVDIKYSPTHMSFYSDSVKSLSKFGVFFQLTISSKSRFHLILRKSNSITGEAFTESIKRLLPDINFTNKVEESNDLKVYIVYISNSDDFESIGKPLVKASYKYLTGEILNEINKF